ncbi:MAG: Trm112 family protein [Alphaproteobacteria bacterium]|nr:Trm112 family protein [Alphaproteobacteria bacterium]
MADIEKSDEIDPRLLEILVCPQSGGVLVYDRAQAELLSKKAGLAYPIRDGVPIMLAEEARTLSDAEIDKL